VAGDPHAIASQAPQQPTAGKEEQLIQAVQGVGTSVQIRNAAGQTLPRQVLLFVLGCPPPKMGKSNVDFS